MRHLMEKLSLLPRSSPSFNLLIWRTNAYKDTLLFMSCSILYQYRQELFFYDGRPLSIVGVRARLCWHHGEVKRTRWWWYCTISLFASNKWRFHQSARLLAPLSSFSSGLEDGTILVISFSSHWLLNDAQHYKYNYLKYITVPNVPNCSVVWHLFWPFL